MDDIARRLIVDGKRGRHHVQVPVPAEGSTTIEVRVWLDRHVPGRPLMAMLTDPDGVHEMPSMIPVEAAVTEAVRRTEKARQATSNPKKTDGEGP